MGNGQTASKDHVSELVGLLAGYDGRFNRQYGQRIIESVVPIRDAINEKRETDGLDLFLNETPNFNDLCAFVNYNFATCPNSDGNVAKLAEKGDVEGAAEFVSRYAESAARARIEDALDGERYGEAVNAAIDFAAKSMLIYGKHQSLGGQAHQLGRLCANAQKKVSQNRFTDGDAITLAKAINKMKANTDKYNNHARESKRLAKVMQGAKDEVVEKYCADISQIEQITTKGLEKYGIKEKAERSIELIGMVWPYVEGTYDPKQIHADNINFGLVATASEKARMITMLKGRLGYLAWEKDPVAQREASRPEKMKEAEQTRETGKTLGKEVMKIMDKMVRYGMADDEMMSQPVAGPNSPNFMKMLGHLISQISATPYQTEMAYAAAVHSDKKRYEKFQKVLKAVDAGVKKRVGAGEDMEAARLSELGQALLGTMGPMKDGRDPVAYPVEAYYEMFPYASLVPVERLATEHADIAKGLGIDTNAIDKKVREAREAGSNGLVKALRKAGRALGLFSE